MDATERLIVQLIDRHQQEIIDFATDIWHNAELGFKETRTAMKFSEFLKKMGLETQENLALTGVKGVLHTGKKGPSICLMGELDALPMPSHKDANPKTGAAHCCGHNAQLAGVMGAAFALCSSVVAKELCGDIVFFGVPAEEYIEIEERDKLRRNGLIRYGCGKCELIRIGAMDDIDLVVGHHSATTKKYLVANRSCNGFITKLVKFKGKSSHAAGAPENGVDAMAAANIAMHAIDAQRESFKDEDTVRVHGCLTKGGSAANIIADDIRLEYSIRGKSIKAYMDAAKKVDRSLKAGAMATGCTVTIDTLPGNLPIVPIKDAGVMREVLSLVCNDTPVTETGPDFHSTSSGDYGDISCIMPLLQFNSGGFSGELHCDNVKVEDPYDAYVNTAKIFALSAYRLLKNNAERAKKIIAEFEPLLTKEQYIDLMESMLTTETYSYEPIVYNFEK